MKTKNAASRPIPTAAQLKKQRVRRVSCIILRILLVLSTILFTWIVSLFINKRIRQVDMVESLKYVD